MRGPAPAVPGKLALHLWSPPWGALTSSASPDSRPLGPLPALADGQHPYPARPLGPTLGGALKSRRGPGLRGVTWGVGVGAGGPGATGAGRLRRWGRRPPRPASSSSWPVGPVQPGPSAALEQRCLVLTRPALGRLLPPPGRPGTDRVGEPRAGPGPPTRRSPDAGGSATPRGGLSSPQSWGRTRAASARTGAPCPPTAQGAGGRRGLRAARRGRGRGARRRRQGLSGTWSRGTCLVTAATAGPRGGGAEAASSPQGPEAGAGRGVRAAAGARGRKALLRGGEGRQAGAAARVRGRERARRPRGGPAHAGQRLPHPTHPRHPSRAACKWPGDQGKSWADGALLKTQQCPDRVPSHGRSEGAERRVAGVHLHTPRARCLNPSRWAHLSVHPSACRPTKDV